MRSQLFRVGAVVGVAVGVLLPFILRPMGHKVRVTTYFADAAGLREGAPVRIAGVDVGSVRSVRVRPELRETPAEVVMVLITPYEMKIPNDATVSVATAGVLGNAYAEIDVAKASGAPIGANAVLKSRTVAQLSATDFMENAAKILATKNCDCGTDKAALGAAATKKVSPKNLTH
jgi:ABC-type transporter Mla subunit MlaD